MILHRITSLALTLICLIYISPNKANANNNGDVIFNDTTYKMSYSYTVQNPSRDRYEYHFISFVEDNKISNLELNIFFAGNKPPKSGTYTLLTSWGEDNADSEAYIQIFYDNENFIESIEGTFQVENDNGIIKIQLPKTLFTLDKWVSLQLISSKE